MLTLMMLENHVRKTIFMIDILRTEIYLMPT